jgi:hypothetical protein
MDPHNPQDQSLNASPSSSDEEEQQFNPQTDAEIYREISDPRIDP